MINNLDGHPPVGKPTYSASDARGTWFASPDPKQVEWWIDTYGGTDPLPEGLSSGEKQMLFNMGKAKIEEMTQQWLDQTTNDFRKIFVGA